TEKCDSRSLYTALSAFFFSFIEEKKNQKEELSGRLGCSALCGVRVRALPSTLGMLRIPGRHFGKGRRKLLPYCDNPLCVYSGSRSK
ncbi:MAG: hypothetical protein K6A33_07245, partial [Clostridiales bacterium]|nr:hypothetical protein [Clostridiales bacterium]